MSTGSGNGLALKRRQAITWTNADPVHQRKCVALGGDEFSRSARTHTSDIVFQLQPFLFKKMHLKMFARFSPFCSSFSVLTHYGLVTPHGYKDLVSTGSGNGLLPAGTKPLPELDLTLSPVSCGIHLRSNSQEVLVNLSIIVRWISKVNNSAKITKATSSKSSYTFCVISASLRMLSIHKKDSYVLIFLTVNYKHLVRYLAVV